MYYLDLYPSEFSIVKFQDFLCDSMEYFTDQKLIFYYFRGRKNFLPIPNDLKSEQTYA